MAIYMYINETSQELPLITTNLHTATPPTLKEKNWERDICVVLSLFWNIPSPILSFSFDWRGEKHVMYMIPSAHTNYVKQSNTNLRNK